MIAEANNKSLQPKKRAFLAAYEKTCNISEAAKASKLTRQAHYKWLREDEDYARIFEESKEIAAQVLEDTAVERAKKGSDVLLIFLLKGARPEKYRERHEIAGKNGRPIPEKIVVEFVKPGNRSDT